VIERLRRSFLGTAPATDPAAAALAALPPGVPERLFDQPLTPAAVLVGIQERPGGLAVLLTRRNESLRDHPGQISFPGGRLATPEESAAAAALREAREEIGLLPARVEIVGYLPPQAVVTGFAISPVIGLVAADFSPVPDPSEVAEVFSVPLDFLMSPGSLQLESRRVRGVAMSTFACHYGNHRIWGATAQILAALCGRLHGN
jgi:8-oxo-dGTP pyrophosphatase MutT (NUDIX family)